jgi:hypothetical protein
MIENYSCPFLGLETDHQTRSACTAIPNFCHRVKPPRPVLADYQQAVCSRPPQTGNLANQILGPQFYYHFCPLYAETARPTRALMANILGKRPFKFFQSLGFRLALVVLVVLLAAGVVYFGQPRGWFGIISTLFTPVSTPTPFSTLVSPLKTATPTPVVRNAVVTLSATPLRQPSLTIRELETSVVIQTSKAAATPAGP